MRDKSGEYKLLKKIGRGGMGQVWAAVRRGLVMPCAIKILHPELAETEKDRRRFFNEARIAAQLDHGRIVKVIDTGEIQGCPFLVMDWVDGVNLRELVEKAREADIPQLDVDVSLFIVGEILAALQYAHNRTVGGHDAGVIHYDVTPGNILISSSGEVKLTDFGIARFAATAGPLSRSVGTPRYMSPEQITGHPLRETDIYSLGVVLHELLEGKRYLDDATPDQFRSRVLLGPPIELTRTDLPEWLRRLVRQMLAVRPEERPSAAAARTLLIDNVTGYHAASRNLHNLYKSLVGEPRSGLTQLLELGEAVEEYGVSAGVAEASLRRRSPPPGPLGFPAISGADEAAAEGATALDGPAAGASMFADHDDADVPLGRRKAGTPAELAVGASSTHTGIPQRSPTPEPTVEPTIEPTIELPVEAPLPARPQMTEPMVLASFARASPSSSQDDGEVHERTEEIPFGSLAGGGAPPSAKEPTPIERAVEPTEPASAAATLPEVERRSPLVQRGLIIGLGALVLVLGATLAWTMLRQPEVEGSEALAAKTQPDPKVEPAPEPEQPARAVPEPRPATEAPSSAPSERVEPPQASPEPTADTPEESQAEAASPQPTDAPPPEPKAQEPEPAPAPAPAPKKKARPDREEIVFLVKKVETGQVKVGSKTLELNYAVATKLRPGSYPVAWRRTAGESWQSCGTLRVEPLPGKDYYEVKLAQGTLSKLVRSRGSAK